MVQRFVLHEFIDVILNDDGKTIIEVGGKRFAQCKYVLISTPVDVVGDSIDAIIENVPPEAKIHEKENDMIPADIEFFAHCSNLQAWVEHDFNTRLLDSRLSFPLLKQLARLGDEKAKRVLQAEIVDRLNSGFLSTIITILDTCSEYIPENLFRMLSTHENIAIQEAIAANEHAPGWLLESMAKSDNETVRARVAGNTRTPLPILEALSKDVDPVCIGLVFNPHLRKLPVSIIVDLIGRDNIDINKKLFERGLSITVMTLLTKSKHYLIRARVVERDYLMFEPLIKLVTDPSAKVRGHVLCRLEGPGFYFEEMRDEAIKPLLEDEGVKNWLLARNTRTPKPMLVVLGNDPDPSIRWEVAANHSSPIDITLKLVSDDDPDVRSKAKDSVEFEFWLHDLMQQYRNK